MKIQEISEKLIHEGKFEYVCRDKNENILFALPIPGLKYIAPIDTKGEVSIPDSDVAKLTKAWINYVEILSIFDAEYIINNNTKIYNLNDKKKYRTRSNAGDVAIIPSTIPTIISRDYQYAMTFNNDKTAYLQLIESGAVQKLKFEDGKLFFDGIESSKAELVTSANLVKNYTNIGIKNIDLVTLRVLYGIILRNISINTDTLVNCTQDLDITNYTVEVYLPDFLKMIGYETKITKNSIDYAISKVSNYNRILGILSEYNSDFNRVFRSIYPVMLFMGYDDKKNVIKFCSPYINILIRNVLESGIKKDKKNKPKVNKYGKTLSSPVHSYLIKSSLAKERNKKAAEIVLIIVPIIEQAHNNTVHISAEMILNKHPALAQALSDTSDPSNKNKLLKNTFFTAWEYLKKDTYINEHYKNFRFPILAPTMKTLDMIFTFSHDGKKSK